MKKLYKIMLIVLFGTSILNAGDGLSQPRLVSTNQSPDSDNVPPSTTLSFTFDSPIIEKSIKKHTVILKQKSPNKKKIRGNITVKDNHTLAFMPSQPLEKGTYKIKVKPIKLQKEGQAEGAPKTKWQKFIGWLCGLVYDDITKCPLCQYVCNVQENIKTKPIKYKFKVKEDAPKVISLESNTTFIELSEHNSTQLSITAAYDDNSSEDITQKASYASSDSSIAEIDKGVLSTYAEGSAAIQADYGNKSITIQVEVYEKIEGHLLPHEPQNPDATLLGVDKNDNGVRDEVERWIYKEMPTYHHPEIERVIAMQQAKATQMALKDPTNKDDKVHKAIDRASNCWFYYAQSKNIPFDGAVEKFNNLLDDKQFNTRERLRTYLNYDYTLKGRVFFDTPSRLLNTSYCDENIDVMP